MIIDFVKLHIAEALSVVAENYGNKKYDGLHNFDLERVGEIIRY